MRIVVKEGNRCYNVFLTIPYPGTWNLLKSFPTKEEGIEWAAGLLKDLSAQREEEIRTLTVD